MRGVGVLAILLLIAGCKENIDFYFDKDGSADPSTSTDQSTGTDQSSASLYQIIVSPSSVSSYLPQQLTATAKYSDGSEREVTDSVTWQSSLTSIVDVNTSGLSSPLTVGTSQVTASLEGVTSDVVRYDVTDSFVCGHVVGVSVGTGANGGVNDVDTSNAAGSCIKVASDNLDNWFTASPSTSFMAQEGFVQNVGSLNSEVTFASTRTEGGTFGPPGGEFATFDQLGGVAHPDGTGNQFDRWCQNLASRSFAGRDNWRRPTRDELSGLRTHKGQSLWTANGWPVGICTHSSTISSGGTGYTAVCLNSGYAAGGAAISEAIYASCIAQP